jgi:hypothetical protein
MKQRKESYTSLERSLRAVSQEAREHLCEIAKLKAEVERLKQFEAAWPREFRLVNVLSHTLDELYSRAK